MENNFEQDSFEEFLKDQLKNHRMFPKDTVWREINQKLHGENRWPGLTVAAFLLVSITILICFHFSSRQSIFSIKSSLEPLQNAPLVAASNGNPTVRQHTTIQFGNEYENGLTTNKVGSQERNTPTENDLQQPFEKKLTSNKMNEETTLSEVESASLHKQPTASLSKSNDNSSGSEIAISEVLTQTLPQFAEPVVVAPVISLITPEPNVAAKEDILKNTSDNAAEEKALSLIESFKAAKRPGKLSMQLYLSPSISYRKLVEDQAVLKGNNNGPVGVNQVSDVNDVVRHKPSKGLEGGVSVLYDIAKRIRIKAGFQFNVRQYSIDAYKSNTEVSSIALVNNNSIDTLNTIAYYRNFNGNSSTELINRYYQVSLPVGMEWEVVGNRKFQFNIAGSIQPTYILNRNAYLLTTNFKNYTENNDLVRKWNINSNFEAFVTMVTGDVKWQLGPQIRYQPYSTFAKQYPIREHLIDYGFKLGISTRIK